MTHLYARVSGRHPANGRPHTAAVKLLATEAEKDAYIRAMRGREGRCLSCGCTPVGDAVPFEAGVCARCRKPKPGHNRRAGDQP